MEVFRIASDKFSKKLIASGKAARWNRDSQNVIYTGQSRSLSTLEMVVHRSSISTALKYEVMVISLANDEHLYTRLFIKDMPENWRENSAISALQETGSNWYQQQRSLILQVPSVIIPHEFNYIINVNHPDFTKHTVVHVRNENYFWDDRLLKPI